MSLHECKLTKDKGKLIQKSILDCFSIVQGSLLDSNTIIRSSTTYKFKALCDCVFIIPVVSGHSKTKSGDIKGSTMIDGVSFNPAYLNIPTTVAANDCIYVGFGYAEKDQIVEINSCDNYYYNYIYVPKCAAYIVS